MTNLINGQNLTLEVATKTIFTNLQLGINSGDRIGIVGQNGSGKTTLLNIINKTISPTSGTLTQKNGLHIGTLSQQDTLTPNNTVAKTIAGNTPEHTWASNPKIRNIISGLLPDIPWEENIKNLSGGQKKRTALAALLTQEWDCLILDEPTNHLDIEGIIWLAQHLKQRWHQNSGALLAITHDRWFLDEISTTTWEVSSQTINSFEGGYAAYILQRIERDRIQATENKKHQALLRKELAWLRRGAPARTSKPKFRIEAANQIIAHEPPARDTTSITQMATSRLGKTVIELNKISAKYNNKTILNEIEWQLAPGERTGILGENGCGKTTLLKIISGNLEPTSGNRKQGKTVNLAVLNQQLTELDSVSNSLLREVIATKKTSYTSSNGKEFTSGQLLEKLGFKNEHLATKIKELSGGQQRRLQLLLILLKEPNVLILDEPTNDMDTDMLAAMEDLLDSWPGTLIVVSHDRYFLERVTDQQYAIRNHKLQHLPGGIEEYLKLRKKDNEISNTKNANKTSSSNKNTNSNKEKIDTRKIQKQLNSVERSIQKNSKKIATIHEKITQHNTEDYMGLADLDSQLKETENELTSLEEQWLELSENL